MSSRHAGFGSKYGDSESTEDFVTIGTHFDPSEPTNSTSILATLGRKASKLVDLSSSNYGYDGKRFHGAFTGGFNAGFYNTVGSVEGWRPSEFKTSRGERAEKRSFEPEDYMDKGDFSEHGINPKQIKIRSTFDNNDTNMRSATKQPSGTSNERSKDDMLRDMIRVKTLSIGKRILMSMGWKPGEGVGAKMSRRHRQKLKWSLTQETPKARPPSPPREEEQVPPGVKVYGVALPPPSFQQSLMKTSRLDDMDDEDDYFDDQICANVSLPPLDYEVHFQLQKQEHHGIGYKPLESLNLFGHDHLFVQPSVTKQINNVKIRGHAFGVGIEEDEDDRDLFAVDDLKQYDYELTAATDTTTDVMREKAQENNFVLKFIRYDAISMPIVYPEPTIPADFRIGHRFPKSEMPPPPPAVTPANNEPVKAAPPVQLDANARGLLLGDLSFLSHPPPNMSVPPPSLPKEEAPPKVEPVVAQALEWDVEKERSSHVTPAPAPTPANNARTQFLDAVKNRFTPSSDSTQFTERQSIEAALENDLKKAASMKLYGDLTRSTTEWKPNPLLCKRMNIPNPYSDDAYEDTKESKKSRRQICSNLFEHLFTQSTTELGSTALEASVPTTNPVISLPSLTSSTSDSPKPVPVKKPIVPPAAPKFEYASIESFDQEHQERPPLDFFSAIFDNQDSDDENTDDKQEEPSKSNNTPSIIILDPPKAKATAHVMPSQQRQPKPNRDSDSEESSDSSIEEIEIPGKSSSVYGPAAPRSLPSRSKTDSDSSMWAKLANTSAQYVELKQKKKHKKKKKKHHKKAKKQHQE